MVDVPGAGMRVHRLGLGAHDPGERIEQLEQRVRLPRGDAACPDLEDRAKVAELFDIEPICAALNEEFHLVPEQSTSAIIVPHTEAKYFIA